MITEKEYRIEMLKSKSESFKGKRIALYGTANNAEAIIRDVDNIDVIALISESEIGKYKYGLRVISLEETLLYDIDMIIIAAEAKSSVIVARRIFAFCITNRIELINMYAEDEIERIRKMAVIQATYLSLNKDEMKTSCSEYDVIVFELTNVICESVFCNDEINIGKSELTQGEEECWKWSLLPNRGICEIIVELSNVNKSIYIISEDLFSRKIIEEVLEEFGINNKIKLILRSEYGIDISSGLLRRGISIGDMGKKVLYIGDGKETCSSVAMSYGFDFCEIKDRRTILYALMNYTGEKKENEYWIEYAKSKISSPFYCDLDLSRLPTYVWTKNTYYNEIGISDECLDGIISPEVDFDIKKIEKLIFPIFTRPIVSIIIPVFNNFVYTYYCLKSVLNNSNDVEYEVIIADDFSSDETKEIEKYTDNLVVVHNSKNLSFLHNCNNAAKYAKGKYILFLNNDTQVTKKWLSSLVNLAEKDEKIGIVGSKLLYPDGSLQEAGGIIWRNGEVCNYGRFNDPNNAEYNYVKDVDYITGASMMVRTDLWKTIGGFDKRYIPAYCEDSDLAFEVRRLGKRVVYQPESVVVHFESKSYGSDLGNNLIDYININKNKFSAKWKSQLEQSHCENGEYFIARERGKGKKIVLVFEKYLSESAVEISDFWIVISILIHNGCVVKFIPRDFLEWKQYYHNFQQNGIEILFGDFYYFNFDRWIIKNCKNISSAVFFDIETAHSCIDIIKLAGIKTIYWCDKLTCCGNNIEEDRIYVKNKLDEWNEKRVIKKLGTIFTSSQGDKKFVNDILKADNCLVVPKFEFPMPHIVDVFSTEFLDSSFLCNPTIINSCEIWEVIMNCI